MVREGEQERAIKGYNPRRPGRNSHHPLIAFVSDLRMIANYRLRPGSTAASTKYRKDLKCHIEGDFLLIWIDEQRNIIKLVRLGTHSELFG